MGCHELSEGVLCERLSLTIKPRGSSVNTEKGAQHAPKMQSTVFCRERGAAIDSLIISIFAKQLRHMGGTVLCGFSLGQER